MVDLAGSESLTDQFGHTQQQETIHINASLFALKSVITALSRNNKCVIEQSTYIHTHTHTYTRTYIHTYIHAYIHTYIHVQIDSEREYNCVCVHVSERERVRESERVCVHVCVCVCVYIILSIEAVI